MRIARGTRLVALLVINVDRTAPMSMTLPLAAERYTLTAQDLMRTQILLNGNPLELGVEDALPTLEGQPQKPGTNYVCTGEHHISCVSRGAQC